MVYRMELTYSKIENILDMIYIASSTIEYTLPPGIYENSDLNLVSKSSLPDDVKVSNTTDDIRLRSNLTTNETKGFTKKSFFYAILGFTQSHSGPLSDPPQRFTQKIPGSNKSEKPINITAIDKVHLKCDCKKGSIVNGIQEPILYKFVFDKPPGNKIYEELSITLFKKISKSVLSHITFYLEDDDHKLVEFNGGKINFTFQLTD